MRPTKTASSACASWSSRGSRRRWPRISAYVAARFVIGRLVRRPAFASRCSWRENGARAASRNRAAVRRARRGLPARRRRRSHDRFPQAIRGPAMACHARVERRPIGRHCQMTSRRVRRRRSRGGNPRRRRASLAERIVDGGCTRDGHRATVATCAAHGPCAHFVGAVAIASANRLVELAADQQALDRAHQVEVLVHVLSCRAQAASRAAARDSACRPWRADRRRRMRSEKRPHTSRTRRRFPSQSRRQRPNRLERSGTRG